MASGKLHEGTKSSPAIQGFGWYFTEKTGCFFA